MHRCDETDENYNINMCVMKAKRELVLKTHVYHIKCYVEDGLPSMANLGMSCQHAEMWMCAILESVLGEKYARGSVVLIGFQRFNEPR